MPFQKRMMKMQERHHEDENIVKNESMRKNGWNFHRKTEWIGLILRNKKPLLSRCADRRKYRQFFVNYHKSTEITPKKQRSGKEKSPLHPEVQRGPGTI